MSTTDLDDIYYKLDEIKGAVSKSSSSGWGWYIFGVFAWLTASALYSDVVHSKFRYATQYGVDSASVDISTKPHDCAFIAAPIGEKYCHYDIIVSDSDIRVNTTLNLASYDGGKTWSAIDPFSAAPKPSHRLFVEWQKVDE